MWIRIDAVGENVIYRKAFSFSLGRRRRPLYGSPALAVRPDIFLQAKLSRSRCRWPRRPPPRRPGPRRYGSSAMLTASTSASRRRSSRRRWWCRQRRGPYEHARPRRDRAPSRMHTAHKMATCAQPADPSAHTALCLRSHTHLAASAASGLCHCGSGGRDGGGSLASRAARKPTGGKC